MDKNEKQILANELSRAYNLGYNHGITGRECKPVWPNGRPMLPYSKSRYIDAYNDGIGDSNCEESESHDFMRQFGF